MLIVEEHDTATGDPGKDGPAPAAHPDAGVPARRGRAALGAKRALDLAAASAALLLLSPVLGVVALAVLVADGRPVLFRQARPGLGARPFTMLKFRTMRAPRPDEIWYATDAERVTRLGRFLRATSLDELPELWNVVRGEMSLVGPRPLLVEYLDHYAPEERRRHEVRPGVTGWAAVNGRNALGFKERLALDVWYVDHWSLWLDLRILARTVWTVLRRSDAAVVEDNAAMGFPLPEVRGGERLDAVALERAAAGEARTTGDLTRSGTT
jgi:lipopolysaccharide/colanic/teichoic acid biosynthesis glycosyltransferase